MSPFGPGDQGPPLPPLDVPTPETKPPTWETIWDAAAKVVYKTTFGSGPGKWIADHLAQWVRIIVQTLLDMVFQVLAQLMKIVFNVFQRSDTGMDQVASAAVSGMFGIPQNPAAYSSVTGAEGRKQVAAQIASTIINTLGAGQTSGGTIKPGHEGAQKFLETTTHMAIEGWLMGWIADAASVHWFERFGDLKDTLEQSLGLGRLARQVMGPPVRVLIQDPYTQELNATYHPQLLTASELVRQYLRGGKNPDRSKLQAQMDLHGYDHDKVDVLIDLFKQHLSVSQLMLLIDNGYIDQDGALERLNAQGYDDVDARGLIAAARQERIEGYQRRAAEGIVAAYADRKINRVDMLDRLHRSGLPDFEVEWLTTLADQRLEFNQARFSMSEGATLVKKGIWKYSQFEQLAAAHGYSASDAVDLELLLIHEVSDATDADLKRKAREQQQAADRADRLRRRQERERIAALMAQVHGVNRAEYEALVEAGLRTPADYEHYLILKQVPVEYADVLTQLLIEKMAQKLAAAALKSAAADKAKARSLDVTQLENAVKQGLLPIQEFTRRMESLGMSATDAGLLTQELQGQIDSAAAKAQVVADHKAAAAAKGVDHSQLERAVRLGLQTIGQYAAFLDSHGYTPESRDLLVNELQAQLDADQATAAKKAAAAKKLSEKAISLTELDRLVRAGVKTTADYQAALASAGYDAQDQAAMMQFLQLQLEQDQQDLITHGHAAGLVGQLGPSLADLGRAVKLGVLPIAAYQDALNRAGVAIQDQQTLVKNLAAAVKDTRKQQSTSAAVSKLVAAAGVSLATLEKDVLNGRLSIEQFQGLLAGYGVPDTQVTAVVSLVQDMLDNKQALAALVDGANAQAASKGLDLAQDTAAYKAGVMSEEEWFSRVENLGYDPADAEILFEILAAKQAATAAKSAPKKGVN